MHCKRPRLLLKAGSVLQTKELVTKRPLLPPSMEFGADTKEVLDTFRLIAELGPRALGAYVISMASAPSDVLAVVLLQKEARLQAASEHNVYAAAAARCITL